MPGWNEYVKPFQDESKFWFGVWKAAGCPDYGELHDIQRTTRMQYKYAVQVRRLKRTSNDIQPQKFIDGLLTGGKNIFSEIRKFRGTSRNIASCVDGQTGADNVSNLFSGIYEDLYSRHHLGEEFIELKQGIERQVDHGLLNHLDTVNHETVKAALQKLKSNKSDALFDFNSDCLINATDNLIQDLFRGFLRTGVIPNFLLLCTLVPIVKDNLADITSSKNCRAIC